MRNVHQVDAARSLLGPSLHINRTKLASVMSCLPDCRYDTRCWHA